MAAATEGTRGERKTEAVSFMKYCTCEDRYRYDDQLSDDCCDCKRDGKIIKMSFNLHKKKYYSKK